MVNRTGFDFILLFLILILVGIGIIMVYSSSYIIASGKFNDGTHFLKKQAIFALVGIFTMLLVRKKYYIELRKYTYPILFISFLLLFLLFIPGIGAKWGGSRRWIRLGFFSFQPTEFAKFALIIFLAHYLSKKGDKIKNFFKGFIPPLIIAGLMIFLILKQPDFGVAVTIGFMTLLMLFVAGAKIKYIGAIFVLIIPFIYFGITMKAYRFDRLIGFWNPWDNPQGSGFQIIQSFVAIGSGGLIGTGLGEGKQKLYYLPEPHTDFIFSVIGEELGLIGIILVVSIFIIILWRGIAIAIKAPDIYGTYLALGLTINICLQAIINMAVAMGLIPTKGITLPFISYGGSSLFINMVSIGILLSISEQCRKF